MGIATVNPATGETLLTFESLTPEEIEVKLTLAEAAFKEYRLTSFVQRRQWMNKAADILERDQQKLGKIITLEMGKTLKSAISEVQKCALVCRFYGDNAEEFLKDTDSASDASQSFIRYQPLGIILAVMPWNFPLWQVFRFAAPALMAGNVGILKHASNVPQSALAIEAIFTEAGLPQGVFQTFLIGASQVETLINDDRVKAAALTGSEFAGAALASSAGKQIKKTVLELGGSDPLIVLESADLEAAATTAVTSRMLSNGQCCISAKRFIVHEAIADKMEQLLVEKFQALKVGDPMQQTTDIGPLATPGILKDIDQQVQKSIQMGAKVLVGGKRLDGVGNFYLPTLLTDIPTGSPADQEEFFGPVASLFRVKTIDEAIAIANNTCFGLGASAWTNDPDEQERLISEIEAGAVFINGIVKSDPRLPFGGIKRSGYGRELGSHGIHEFVNIKTVWIK